MILWQKFGSLPLAKQERWSDVIAVEIELDMDKVKDFSTFVWIRPVLSIALQDVVSLPKHTNPVNRESPNSCNTFNNPTTNVAENFRNLIFLVEFEIPNYQKQTIQQQMFQKKYISDGLCNLSSNRWSNRTTNVVKIWRNLIFQLLLIVEPIKNFKYWLLVFKVPAAQDQLWERFHLMIKTFEIPISIITFILFIIITLQHHFMPNSITIRLLQRNFEEKGFIWYFK